MIPFPWLAVSVTLSGGPSSSDESALTIAIVVGVYVALAVGFVLGYLVRQRPTSGERKAGFPVLPVRSKPDLEVP